MFKTRADHPILRSPQLTRLMLGAAALRDLERRLPELLGNRKFKAALELEMLRSDRTATTLTLLLFSLAPRAGTENRNLLLHLGRIMCSCTRKTDIKGWFRDRDGVRVGLLLTNTQPERAKRIIRQIEECHRDEALLTTEGGGEGGDGAGVDALICEVYSYPPYHAGTGPQARRAEPEEEGEPDTGNGAGNGSEYDANGGEPAEEEQGGAEDAEGGVASIMELLRDPLPLWKRTLDVTVSLGALTAVAPLLGLIALGIKLTSRGPVIFKQDRVGYHGRIFKCFKFRSMRVNADPTAHRHYLSQLIEQSTEARQDEEEAPMVKLDKQNPQITPLGRLLRTSCLDELPQLFNVLRGDMSLVGPRPCLPYEAEKYQRWHFRRLDTVPGITGLWQVKGKNKVTFRKMIRLDIFYTRERSLWLDLKILMQTIPAVLREIRDGLPAKIRRA